MIIVRIFPMIPKCFEIFLQPFGLLEVVYQYSHLDCTSKSFGLLEVVCQYRKQLGRIPPVRGGYRQLPGDGEGSSKTAAYPLDDVHQARIN